jgi:peptide/nickel transport system substrate-binding protein
VLEGKDGRPLAFKLTYPANSDTFNRIVLFLKDTYARAGVVIEPEPLEWSVLLKRIENRDLEAMSLGWTGGIESDPYQIFHSSQIQGVGDNTVSYSNPELDRLIEKARTTVDEEQRMPLWHQVHCILHEDQPYTFLFTRDTLAFYDRRIYNIQQTTTGLSPLREWYVPANQVKWTAAPGH